MMVPVDTGRFLSLASQRRFERVLTLAGFRHSPGGHARCPPGPALKVTHVRARMNLLGPGSPLAVLDGVQRDGLVGRVAVLVKGDLPRNTLGVGRGNGLDDGLLAL